MAEKLRSDPTSAPVWASAARAPISDVPTLSTIATLPASASRRRASSKAAGRRTVSRNMPTTRHSGSSAKYAVMSATSVIASLPAETTVRKPTRGPSETRISPIEPEWTSVATGPPVKSSVRVPIHGDGAPGVAIPMQFGPTMEMPAASTRRRIRSATGGPSGPASFPSPGAMIARTPSTDSTSSTAASIRPWPTPITTISGTPGQSAMLG